MTLSRNTAPSVEPVTLEEARNHLRVEPDGSPASHPDDTLIEALIQAAREWCETETNRAFVEQQFELKRDTFPSGSTPIELPLPPLRSVDNIEYEDGDGVTQTWSASQYRVIKASGPKALPGYVQPTPDESYPTDVQDAPDSVMITFTAGYEPDTASSPTDYRANVPAGIKRAILMLVAHWYEHREAVMVGASVGEMPFAVKALLAPFVVPQVA